MYILQTVLLYSAERNDWVTVLQDCNRGRHRRSTMSPGLLLTPDFQGYLELKGLRSKLYTVVASDKVYLYKQLDVRIPLRLMCSEMRCVYKSQFIM